MAADRKAVLAKVTGRVQGVAFRAWTKKQADALRVTGWVRNEDDGTVSALVIGSGDAVAAMIELLWKGPRLASVAKVETRSAEIDDIPGDFRITG